MSQLLQSQILPLYLFIFLGFLAGKFFQVSAQILSSLLIYFLAPLVVFTAMIKAPATTEVFVFPILLWAISSSLALFALKFTNFFKGPTQNLFAFGSGNANTGYFGIPVTLAIFGEDHLPYAVLVALGLILYENTVGYYISARAHSEPREALAKLLRLPAVYAVALALFWRWMNWGEPTLIPRLAELSRATYSVLGFMIIGIGLASLKVEAIDFKYLAASQISKFVIWPSLIFVLLLLTRLLGISFSSEAKDVLRLMAFVPMAANTVVFASLLRIEPQKASLAVVLSTLLGLVLLTFQCWNWIPA